MIHAGRALIRALVVIGGAAAVSAVAWLMATASASTLTDAADEPIGSGVQTVVSAIGDPKPSLLPQLGAAERVNDVATPALARVRGLSEAVTRTPLLPDVLDTRAIRKVTAVPATVLTLGRLTELKDFFAPPESPLASVGSATVDSVTAEPHDALPAPANTDSRDTSADSAAGTQLRKTTTSIGGQPDVDLGSDQGVGGAGGRSGLQSCVIPAGAGFAGGHDRGCGDVVQPRPQVARLQSSRRWTRVQCHAVTAAEIQPGVTPD
ncbi:hypothetical protein [Amycolatopsis sp. cmx-4-61]|uniref:hypothetical protein n=1 Tax=Amycolatopsis sp. cmx-4-61 TaxID=2790937 RepID=UPI00397CED26